MATAAQQFNLRWNNHTMNMLQILSDNFEKETLVDVTISCQGKIIKAHKIVLGACSQQFQDIFDQHEAPHPVIIMNGVKYDDIRAIVEFMYKGEVKITESDLESLLATAEGLQVKGLSNVRATRPSTGQQIQNSHGSFMVEKSQENGIEKGTSLNSSSDLPNNRINEGIDRNNSNHSTSSTNSPHRISSPTSSTLPRNNCSPRRTQSSSTTINSQASGNTYDNDTGGGTLTTNRRKRAKLSPVNKDVNQNRCREPKPKRKAIAVTLDTVSPSVDDENSDELPMTIKIDPPHIRDIDEEDEEDGGTKDSTLETCDGHQDVKEIVTKHSLMRMSGYTAAGAIEPKEKIPRPPNAFMIFANEWRRKLAVQYSNESNKEISVRLGIMWKNLASQQKEEYFAASRQANDDHKKKYPDYYYSPKEARMRKRWKIQQQQVNQMMSAGQYNPVHLVKVYMDESDGSVRKQSSGNQPTATQLKEK